MNNSEKEATGKNLPANSIWCCFSLERNEDQQIYKSFFGHHPDCPRLDAIPNRPSFEQFTVALNGIYKFWAKTWMDKLTNAQLRINNLVDEQKTLREKISTPHTEDFLEAVPLEAAFQIDHWGTEHDEGKTPLDWFWLVGYLSQKVVVSINAGDREKAKHHTISTAAVMLNWFRRIEGEEESFKPGISKPK